MNAYRAYDAIDDRKWVEQQLNEEREAWVERRAQELISALPKTPALLSLFLKPDAAASLYGNKAAEAFNDFITACAYEKAEAEWRAKVAPCPF